MRTSYVAIIITLSHYSVMWLRNGSNGDCFNHSAVLLNKVRSSVLIKPFVTWLLGCSLIYALCVCVFFNSDMYRLIVY